MRSYVALFFGLILSVTLSACSTSRPTPAVFDLGPAPAKPVAAATAPPIQLVDLSAPSWLSGSGIAYRLDYADPLRRELYRDSRWAAPPAELLAERLRQRAAVNAGPGKLVQLRLELEEFSQVFASPTQSRAVLRVRAWAGDTPMPRVFAVSVAVSSADAAGGVQALSRASDELIDQLLSWAATPLQ